MATDPFTQVHDALWALLEANEGITSLVKVGNRLKLNGKYYAPFKEKHSNTDYPEITIIPSGGDYNPAITSDSGHIEQYFDITVIDGDLRATRKYLPLKWAIIKALASIDANLGLDFVRRITLTDIDDSLNAEDMHVGWTAVFRLNVEMWFTRAYLKS